jgi:hypothetical protein
VSILRYVDTSLETEISKTAGKALNFFLEIWIDLMTCKCQKFASIRIYLFLNSLIACWNSIWIFHWAAKRSTEAFTIMAHTEVIDGQESGTDRINWSRRFQIQFDNTENSNASFRQKSNLNDNLRRKITNECEYFSLCDAWELRRCTSRISK